MSDATVRPDLWLREVHQDAVALAFRVVRTIFSGRSDYQRVDVVETAAHGRMLLNDGVVMLSERDEFVYHEMIAHVPLFVHPAPRRVLIIGGGDGGTAREVMRHRRIDQVVLVEIDALVVKACRRHLPSVAAAFDDPRLELIIGDGVAYAAQCRQTFDVVIVDSTDPVGPAQPLFDEAFYRSVSRLLADDGILVTQAESPFYDTALQCQMLARQRSCFQRLHLYLFPTLTYPGGLWSFGFASRGLCPVGDLDPGRIAAADLACRYYSAAVHRAAFVLPGFVVESLGALLNPLTL